MATSAAASASPAAAAAAASAATAAAPASLVFRLNQVPEGWGGEGAERRRLGFKVQGLGFKF